MPVVRTRRAWPATRLTSWLRPFRTVYRRWLPCLHWVSADRLTDPEPWIYRFPMGPGLRRCQALTTTARHPAEYMAHISSIEKRFYAKLLQPSQFLSC